MGMVLDNRGHTDKIRGYSTPLKWHSKNAGVVGSGNETMCMYVIHNERE